VGLFRQRPQLRPLDERECYLRLHGTRSGDVEVVRVLPRPPPRAPDPPAEREIRGPTDLAPALHLVIAYPRDGARMTGEQVRRELLRRMESRAGEAA
jgi:hypothetical protein